MSLIETKSRKASWCKGFVIKGIDAIFGVCDKTKTSVMKIDGVFSILDEAPGKLANAILLFTKGLGWLTSIDLPNVERRSSQDSIGGRRMSMDCFRW